MGKTNLKDIKKYNEEHEQRKTAYKEGIPRKCIKSLQKLDINDNNKAEGIYYLKILPPFDNSGIPWISMAIHYDVSDNRMYHKCINDTKEYNGKCPSCIKVKKMYKNGNEEDAKKSSRKFRYLFNIWDFDAAGTDDDPYIKVLAVGTMAYEEFATYFEDDGDITELTEGYCIRVTRKKYGDKSRYMYKLLNKDKFKLGKAEIKLVESGLHDLNKFMPTITPEDIKKMWITTNEDDYIGSDKDKKDKEDDDDDLKDKKEVKNNDRRTSKKDDDSDDIDNEDDDELDDIDEEDDDEDEDKKKKNKKDDDKDDDDDEEDDEDEDKDDDDEEEDEEDEDKEDEEDEDDKEDDEDEEEKKIKKEVLRNKKR